MGFGLGGMFGSIFWKLGLSESSISGRVSLFVNVAMNVAMLGCTRALQTLAVETRVVNLERMDEGYSASAYLSSKILAETPTDAVFPFIFGTVVYFMAGLNSPLGGGLKLTRYLATLLLQAHASSAVGLMVGCLSPSMEAANLLGPAVMIISLMLSGVSSAGGLIMLCYACICMYVIPETKKFLNYSLGRTTHMPVNSAVDSSKHTHAHTHTSKCKVAAFVDVCSFVLLLPCLSLIRRIG
ncbi:unnamed protein product [Ectocarpus sp. 4 AP-2014]